MYYKNNIENGDQAEELCSKQKLIEKRWMCLERKWLIIATLEKWKSHVHLVVLPKWNSVLIYKKLNVHINQIGLCMEQVCNCNETEC